MQEADLPRWALQAAFEFLEEDPKCEEWELLSLLGRHRMIVEQAVAGLEFSSLAKYAFILAQKFNGFYHRHPVLQQPLSVSLKGGLGPRSHEGAEGDQLAGMRIEGAGLDHCLAQRLKRARCAGAVLSQIFDRCRLAFVRHGAPHPFFTIGNPWNDIPKPRSIAFW